jgi:hypothetical protein
MDVHLPEAQDMQPKSREKRVADSVELVGLLVTAAFVGMRGCLNSAHLCRMCYGGGGD